jgi:hypothetical protein
MTPEELEEFMRVIFAPPPKGTKRMFIAASCVGIRTYRTTSGVADSVEVTDDEGETWRKPTDEERPLIMT